MRQTLLLITALIMVSCSAMPVRYSPTELEDLSPDIQEKIIQGKIAKGMTPREVRYSWGAPYRIEILLPDAEGRRRELWTYSTIGLFRTRILFTEGKVSEVYSTEPGIADKGAPKGGLPELK